jgi:hypothetical protein
MAVAVDVFCVLTWRVRSHAARVTQDGQRIRRVDVPVAMVRAVGEGVGVGKEPAPIVV